MAYSKSATFTPTVSTYLNALKLQDSLEVDYIHVTHDARIGVDFNDYDVLFHNYCARLCFEGYVSEAYERAVAGFRGLKVVAVQDDYDRTATLHRAIRRLGFHLLLTCIQRPFWPLVYPASELPGVRVEQVMTGYVPPELEDLPHGGAPLSERKPLLVYRGRKGTARYGRLFWLKWAVGDVMRRACEARGLPHDIKLDDSERIYGQDWYRFLRSGRAALASESASNAFDFDGVIEDRIRQFEEEHGRTPAYEDLAEFLAPFEAPFDVGQVAPRIFETAALRTPMVNIRGGYSGVIEPDRHYIPINPDFSNVDEVFARLEDIPALEAMAERAYRDVVASGRYAYRNFARQVADLVLDEYPRRVDPDWIAYRQKTGRPWSAPARIDEPETLEQLCDKVLLEFPTDAPGTTEEFMARLREVDDCWQEICNRHAAESAERERQVNEAQMQAARARRSLRPLLGRMVSRALRRER